MVTTGSGDITARSSRMRKSDGMQAAAREAAAITVAIGKLQAALALEVDGVEELGQHTIDEMVRSLRVCTYTYKMRSPAPTV